MSLFGVFVPKQYAHMYTFSDPFSIESPDYTVLRQHSFRYNLFDDCFLSCTGFLCYTHTHTDIQLKSVSVYNELNTQSYTCKTFRSGLFLSVFASEQFQNVFSLAATISFFFLTRLESSI